MNASAHQTSLEIHTLFVKNAEVLNVNAKHHTNSLVEIAYWQAVKMAESVHQVLNAFQLLAV